jgi:hypothetical protein
MAKKILIFRGVLTQAHDFHEIIIKREPLK